MISYANVTRLGIPSLEQSIKASTSKLKSDINNKYRAWGKLSGDPLALLRNNEQGLVAVNKDLAKYAQQSSVLSDVQRQEYLSTTNEIATTLHHVVNAREKLFTQQPLNARLVEQPLNDLASLIAKLNRYPALNIIEEAAMDDDEDDLLLDDEDEAEDLSADALSELNSLSNRYKGELNNTINSQRQRERAMRYSIVMSK